MSGLTERDQVNEAEVALLHVLRTPTMKALKEWEGHEHVQVMHGLRGYAGRLVKVTAKYAHIDQPRLRGVEKFPLAESGFVIHWTEAEKKLGWAVRPYVREEDGQLYSAEKWTCLGCWQRLPNHYGDVVAYTYAAHVADDHDRPTGERVRVGGWDQADVRIIEPGRWWLTIGTSEYTIERKGYRRRSQYAIHRGHLQWNDPHEYRTGDAYQTTHAGTGTTIQQAIFGAHLDAELPGALAMGMPLPEPWNQRGVEVLAAIGYRQHGMDSRREEKGRWKITVADSDDLTGYIEKAEGTPAEALLTAVGALAADQDIDLLDYVVTSIEKKAN